MSEVQSMVEDSTNVNTNVNNTSIDSTIDTANLIGRHGDSYYTPFLQTIIYDPTDIIQTAFAVTAENCQSVSINDIPIHPTPTIIVFDDKNTTQYLELGFQKVIVCKCDHEAYEYINEPYESNADQITYTTLYELSNYVPMINGITPYYLLETALTSKLPNYTSNISNITHESTQYLKYSLKGDIYKKLFDIVNAFDGYDTINNLIEIGKSNYRTYTELAKHSIENATIKTYDNIDYTIVFGMGIYDYIRDYLKIHKIEKNIIVVESCDSIKSLCDHIPCALKVSVDFIGGTG